MNDYDVSLKGVITNCTQPDNKKLSFEVAVLNVAFEKQSGAKWSFSRLKTRFITSMFFPVGNRLANLRQFTGSIFFTKSIVISGVVNGEPHRERIGVLFCSCRISLVEAHGNVACSHSLFKQ